MKYLAVFLGILICFVPNSDAYADAFKNVYNALEKTELAALKMIKNIDTSITNQDKYRAALLDAENEMELSESGIDNKIALSHLKKALYAFEIIGEIGSTGMGSDWFDYTGNADVSQNSYKSWITAFPSLLEEVPAAKEACKKDTCGISDSSFEYLWLPGLVYEAKTEMAAAEASRFETDDTRIVWDEKNPEKKITILSKGPLGFRKNNRVYLLGMDIHDFISDYGKPDKTEIEKDEEHKDYYLYDTVSYRYHNDGIVITSRGNRIIGMSFDFSNSDGIATSNAVTQDGIWAGIE